MGLSSTTMLLFDFDVSFSALTVQWAVLKSDKQCAHRIKDSKTAQVTAPTEEKEKTPLERKKKRASGMKIILCAPFDIRL